MINTARPFPFTEKYNPFGNKPSIGQEQLNKDVQSFYDIWKTEYLQAAVSYPNCYYIKTGGGTNAEADSLTVSEGHGYGMITIALMAGYDERAKEYFDGLYHFFRKHPSDIASELPSWQVRGIVGEYETADCFSSATDGDFDVAYSLLLADKQWGSDGEINYRAEAQKMITQIYQYDIHHESYRILLGDWAKEPDTLDKYKNATRPSDWMPAQLRAFAEVDTDSNWNKVIETIYDLSRKVAHPTTGLLPDFVVNNTPTPAEPNFLENPTDGSYSANACRVPWRIGMDYLHFESNDAYSVVSNLMNWLDTVSGNSIDGVANGYELDGTPTYEDNFEPWGMYAAPFMVAATCDSKYQSFLDSSWNYLSQFAHESGYYSNSITMLCLLAVSGNWWNPTR